MDFSYGLGNEDVAASYKSRQLSQDKLILRFCYQDSQKLVRSEMLFFMTLRISHLRRILDNWYSPFLDNWRSTFGWVKITNVSDFLSGEKDSSFIEEEIKEMWGEVMILLRVKLLNMLIKEVKGLYSFAIHLHFHFIKDLVRLVSPVHEVTKIL